MGFLVLKLGQSWANRVKLVPVLGFFFFFFFIATHELIT